MHERQAEHLREQLARITPLAELMRSEHGPTVLDLLKDLKEMEVEGIQGANPAKEQNHHGILANHQGALRILEDLRASLAGAPEIEANFKNQLKQLSPSPQSL